MDMQQNQGLEVASPEKKPQTHPQTIATPAQSRSNAPLLEGEQDPANAVLATHTVPQQPQAPVPSQDASHSAPVPKAMAMEVEPHRPSTHTVASQQLNAEAAQSAPCQDAAQSAPVPKATAPQLNVPAPLQDASQSAPVPQAMQVEPEKPSTDAVTPQQLNAPHHPRMQRSQHRFPRPCTWSQKSQARTQSPRSNSRMPLHHPRMATSQHRFPRPCNSSRRSQARTQWRHSS